MIKTNHSQIQLRIVSFKCPPAYQGEEGGGYIKPNTSAPPALQPIPH